ncbi:MAG: hypothetical protein OXE56_02180 [Gammaproteobacteria bacterium]|nr:hypothetical protein [Gammaproteobacteria bacterium]
MITDTSKQGLESIISTAIAEHSYGSNSDSMKLPVTPHVGTDRIVALNDKSPIAHVATEKFRALAGLITSLNQETTIARLLGHAIHQIDQLAEKYRQSITLLRGHHASLITETITGQIDVITWNAQKR